MDDVRIRRAEPRDAFVVAALTLQDDRESGAEPRPGFLDEFADAWLADRRRVTWIAEESSGRPVGVIHASVVPDLPSNQRPTCSWLHVSQLFVTADRRGGSIGSDLLATLVRWAQHEGVSRVQMAASEAGHGLAEVAGFDVGSGDFLTLDPSVVSTAAAPGAGH